MIIAIATLDSATVPAVLHADDVDGVLALLRTLKGAPALASEADARTWLATLAQPSGLFLTSSEAKAYLQNATQKRSPTMTGSEISEARDLLGLTRADFAAAIGIGGNSNTRHKAIYDFEMGKRGVGADVETRIRALLASQSVDDVADTQSAPA